MQKIIILSFLLLCITYTQAQDWISNESTLLCEDSLKSSKNVQNIEEYYPNMLLTTTNKIGINHYAFRLWENGNPIFEGFLNDTKCVVSDVELVNDSAYFCGYRTVNGNDVGYIGRFNVHEFLGNQNCVYEIMDINPSSKLKKLVAYETYGKDHVVAIGTTQTNTAMIVDMFPDSVCNIFGSTLFPYEQLSDIAVGAKYVIIVGEDTGSAKITVNRFMKHNLSSTSFSYQLHYKYNYNTITSLAPDAIFSDQIKISYIGNNEMAITTTAIGMNTNDFYVLNSILNEGNLTITNTQAIPHNDKMMYLKDTEYDTLTGKLYILEDNNLDNTGKYTSYIIPINPRAETPYSINAIKPEKGYILNDIIPFSHDCKVIGAGVNSYSMQGLFAKNINSNIQYCNTSRKLRPSFLGQIPFVSTFLYQLQIPNFPINWMPNQFQGNVLQQTIECESN